MRHSPAETAHSPVGEDRTQTVMFSMTGAKEWGARRRRPRPARGRLPDSRDTSRREDGRTFQAENVAWAGQGGEEVVRAASKNCKQFPGWDPRAHVGGWHGGVGHEVGR